MLHHVAPQPLDPPPLHGDSYLTPEDFQRFLDLLDRRRFTTVTLAQAARLWHQGRSLPRRTVVLTFDDGCRCFTEHALPALAERGRSATLFVLSGKLGGTNDWDRGDPAAGGRTERREELLTAEELREVRVKGPHGSEIEIGCHGRTHVSLPECGDDSLRRETAGAKAELEAVLGSPVVTFCYPWGRSSPRVREAVRSAGFLAAAGIEDHPGAAANDPWGLRRWSLRPDDSAFEMWLKATGGYRWWRRLPRLGLLAALRRRGNESRPSHRQGPGGGGRSGMPP